MTTALFMLRCKQIGFSFFELDCLPLSLVMGVFVEQGNDGYDYPIKATQEDIDLL